MTSAPVKIFYILDFDRCLGDTSKLQSEFEQAIERKTSVSSAQLALARQEIELSGGSFDAAAYVQGILKESAGNVSWEEICEDMIAHARQKDMLEPGARKLLEILEDRGEYFGILTYGGADWQRTKLAAARVEDIPVLITQDPGKGKNISSWKLPDGTFALPDELSGTQGLHVNEIILIDDKALSFKDIPPGVSGFHVLRSDRKIMPSQKGETPLNVQRAEGIHDVIKLLFSK